MNSGYVLASGATISPCGLYRYHLWRQVSKEREATGRCTFVMCNPSTADETQDDPTIRRCIAFTRQWQCEFLDVLNLFAYRSPDPSALLSAADPIGPDNDSWLDRAGYASRIIVAAWGVHGTILGRGEVVRQRLAATRKLHYLKLTKDGHPGHPLYLPANSVLMPWQPTGSP